MPCTAGLERHDYLDFLPKRPQGTTKILGTSAFAGTKTPAALKFPSKGATTDCVETPVNCPHCGQKRLGRASVPTPALYPAFFFVLGKAAKGVGNAVIPTFPAHCPHGLQHLRYKRPMFAFVGESGYTLGFRRKIAHSGSQGETGAFPSAITVRLCAASEIPFIPPCFYIHTFPGSLWPLTIGRREKVSEDATATLSPTIPHCVFQLRSQMAHVRFRL